MMTASPQQPISSPNVLWAQRTNSIYLTIEVASAQNIKIDIQKQKVTFHGTGGNGANKGIEYELSLELFDEIDPESSNYVVSPLNIFFNLVKHQKDQPFWPRLLTSTTKPRFLKTDFNRWRDEDESEDEAENDDMMRMMRESGMNPMQGMDFSKMGMGMPDMGMSPDSDDEEELDEKNMRDEMKPMEEEATA